MTARSYYGAVNDRPRAVVLLSGGVDSTTRVSRLPSGFIAAFERLARLATKAGVEGRPIRVRAPLIRMTKAEIVRAGALAGVDYGLMLSCYEPAADGGACGACDACALRRKGFAEAGLADPTRYRG